MTGGSQEQPLLAAEIRQALSPDLNHHLHHLHTSSHLGSLYHLTHKSQLPAESPQPVPSNTMNSPPPTTHTHHQLNDNHPHNNNTQAHNKTATTHHTNLLRQPEEPSNQQEQERHDEEEEEEEEEEIELLSEALLGVASAEEYAAKIVRIQQACLTPLKEDLADWLNKIMSVSTITSTNFMDKLDNGVVICRLAKVISSWCMQQNDTQQQQQQQQLETTTTLPQQRLPISMTGSQLQLNSPNSCSNYPLATNGIRPSTKLSTSNISVHSSLNSSSGELSGSKDYHYLHNYRNRKLVKSPVISTSPKQNRYGKLINNKGPTKSSSQSTYCLMSSNLSIASQPDYFRRDLFSTNFKRINQTKIWEEAKSRTFYARDNVCNFIKWSKDFGVNQSVLFESDDLVLHANTRQVVLCLLDVARIACVKHGFVEAPGLVKFEQEMGREKASAAIYATVGNHQGQNCNELVNFDAQIQNNSNSTLTGKRLPSLPRHTIGDATDDLIMRYCIHKEEEASRKRAAELESIKMKEQEEPEPEAITELNVQVDSENEQIIDNVPELVDNDQNNSEKNNNRKTSDEMNYLLSYAQENCEDANMMLETSPQKDSPIVNSHKDSLDSGDGRTESASTSHNTTPINVSKNKRHNVSSIPVPIKRSNSNMSLTSNHTSSIAASEMSSSRSSLLSGQDANSSQSGNNNKHHITSDLDGKVMHIAKSYYGKAATKGITRLSEGKYKIADRIVFVRLLKGHRVMVRIGGGWETLENFLFRHKSDPSQVIDVDNLLPLESKMTPDKSSQILLTPTHNKSTSSSKLPYYKRSSSGSSTNLSTCKMIKKLHLSKLLNLFTTPGKFYVAPINEVPGHREEFGLRLASHALVIDRQTGRVSSEADFSKSNLPPDTESKTIHGIVGIKHLPTSAYLIVVTGIQSVGCLDVYQDEAGAEVYRVTKVELLPLDASSTTSSTTSGQNDWNQQYVNMMSYVFESQKFYFSFRYDLTRSLQANQQSADDHKYGYDKRFLWNRHLMSDFDTCKDAEPFGIPLINGFVGIRHIATGQKGSFILISRRAVARAGVRFIRRGVDQDGNVANFVETEQILSVRLPDRSFALASLVQVRGSVPLIWKQTTNYKYTPKIQIDPHQDHDTPLTKHLSGIIGVYGDVSIVNLINQHGHEGKLEREFRLRLSRQQKHYPIPYYYFDFHKECAGMRWDRLSLLLNRLEKDMDSYGFFATWNGAELQRQTGVIRTNCIDSLDRTNVIQSQIAFKVLGLQCRKLRLVPEDSSITDNSLSNAHRLLWTDNANQLSLQYAGTPALKTDVTRTGNRTVRGMMNDGWNSMTRYVINNFLDNYRQDSIDLFLGNFEGYPSPLYRPMTVANHTPTLIIITITLVALYIYTRTQL